MEENINTQNTQEAQEVKPKKPLTDEEIVANNEKWFKFFIHVPKITAIVIAALFFVWGIVAAAFGRYLELNIFFMLWWLIGAVVSGLVYVILKLTCSYRILHIYLLKKLNKDN